MFVLNKACPVICKVAICTEFCQFGKKSIVVPALNISKGINPFSTEPLAIFLLLETDNLGINH